MDGSSRGLQLKIILGQWAMSYKKEVKVLLSFMHLFVMFCAPVRKLVQLALCQGIVVEESIY